MPTPPLHRRNPAVSIRRVQSERKYLNHWGSVSPPCPIWKRQYDYARRTAIIPPFCHNVFKFPAAVPHPHMVGISQGILGCPVPRGFQFPPHHQSQTHPLILVAPPLFVRGYAPQHLDGGPLSKATTEEEFLSQERIASFLTEETASHKPRSLLSYPDSHLYESLISQLSDLNAEDISIESSKLETDHSQHRPNSTSQISPASKQEEETHYSSNKLKNKEENYFRNDLSKFSFSSEEFCTKSAEESTSRSSGQNSLTKVLSKKPSNASSSLSKLNPKDSLKKISFSKEKSDKVPSYKISKSDHVTRTSSFISDKPLSHLASLKNDQFMGNKRGRKSILKPKGSINETRLQSNPNAVSVVQVNTENGIDEVTIGQSTCYKCDSSDFMRNQSEDCDYRKENFKSRRQTSPDVRQRMRLNIRKSRAIKVERSKSCRRDYHSCSSDNRTPRVPLTIELLESEPLSSQSSNDTISLRRTSSKKDVRSPASSMDMRYYGSDCSKSSTLDPLKPPPLKNQEKREPLVPQIVVKNLRNISSQQTQRRNNEAFGNNRPITPKNHSRLKRSTSTKRPPQKADTIMDNLSSDYDGDCIPPLTVNFSSEESSSSDDEKLEQLHQSSIFYMKDEVDVSSIYSSVLEFYSIATTSPDSFVYVYKSPATIDRSNSSSTNKTTSMSLRFTDVVNKDAKTIKRTGSSGLGSSGSDNSFEDVSLRLPSSSGSSSTDRDSSLGNKLSANASSVTFLEPSFRPETRSSSGRTLSSRNGRLSFDYSCSWSDLNELVKRSSSFGSFNSAGIQRSSRKFCQPPRQEEKYNFASATYTKKALVL